MAPKGDITSVEERLIYHLQAVQRADEKTTQASQTSQSATNTPIDPDNLLARAKSQQTDLQQAITVARLSLAGADIDESETLVTLPANMTQEQGAEAGLSKEQVARANMSEEQRAKYRSKQDAVRKAGRMRLLLYQRMGEFYAGGGASCPLLLGEGSLRLP